MFCRSWSGLLILSGLALPLALRAQGHVVDSTSETGGSSSGSRFLLTLGTHSVLLPLSFAVLDQYWYKGYRERSFHFTNDFDHWNNMDKAGHVWSAYNLTRLSSRSWKWAGMSPKKADITGAAVAFAYQTAIEAADGLSSKWGFSLGDFAANLTGIGIYSAQQLIWKEQKLEVKVLACSPYRYPESVAERSRELFGNNILEHLLSDYNIQSYWLSTSVNSFHPNSKLPGWLGVSVGYGSGMMLGEKSNQWLDRDGQWISRTDIRRQRRFFLSPDLIFTRIPTRKTWLKTMFWVLSAVKLPAPTLEFSSRRIRAHFLLLN